MKVILSEFAFLASPHAILYLLANIIYITMNNHEFNIMNQLIQEQKSLWRIEKHYIEEAKNKDEVKFWKKMKTQKTKNIAELSVMAKKAL